ncbi:MAG: hypothetical protein N3E40_01310 [Dehalococcoidia bacterium]|nr:hypothetical protein [Dehalococcoidia bacterium]
MAEELGRIEKPLVETFKRGRKIFFIPLVYKGRESPAEYLEKFERYWDQVEGQLADLEVRLGKVSKVYHELVSSEGEEGVTEMERLNEGSYRVAKKRLAGGARLEVLEDREVLTEFMDWRRCLAIGLQNQKVFETVYQFYIEASKRRNESISKRLNDTLKSDEIGILFMREEHQVQFPAGIEVFYVSPPALDELNRWLRDYESRKAKESEAGQNNTARSE